MGHYLAWVVANNEEDVAKFMAPHVEEFEEQWDATDKSIIAMEKDHKFHEWCDEKSYPHDLEHYCQWHGGDYRDGKLWTWRNPIGQWDWYIIGGRWNPNDVSQYDSDPSCKFTPATAPESSPYSFVTGEGFRPMKIYHEDREFPDCFEDVPDWDEKIKSWLSMLSPDQFIFIVDYHS